jgi:REP element-mobilizing transposase RayT
MGFDYLVFMTWKTWGSSPSIDREQGTKLIGLLPVFARREGAALLEIAVVSTHVHVVARTQPRVDVPRLAQRMKGASSRYLNLDRGSRLPLRWAPGYDARTIGRPNLTKVRAYFDEQARRHRMDWVLRWSEGMSWPAPDEPRVVIPS